MSGEGLAALHLKYGQLSGAAFYPETRKQEGTSAWPSLAQPDPPQPNINAETGREGEEMESEGDEKKHKCERDRHGEISIEL